MASGSSPSCKSTACLHLLYPKLNSLQVRLWQQTLLEVLVSPRSVRDAQPGLLTLRFRNDDYLAKAGIPVDMGIIERLLAEEA